MVLSTGFEDTQTSAQSLTLPAPVDRDHICSALALTQAFSLLEMEQKRAARWKLQGAMMGWAGNLKTPQCLGLSFLICTKRPAKTEVP